MYYPDASPMDAPPSHYTGEVKSINHSGTRLKSHDVTRMNIGEITSIERQRTDQVWKQLAQATPALFNQNNTSQTPKHDQDTTYNFVPSTPLLEHGKDGIDAADLMTWGEIEGTPLLLDLGGDHTDFIFNIPDTPHREK